MSSSKKTAYLDRLEKHCTYFTLETRFLNSKNECVQNCMGRITISLETWERKERERREEEEEILEEQRLAEFKTLKQATITVREDAVQDF